MRRENRTGRCIHCGGGVSSRDRRVTHHETHGMAHKSCAFSNNGLKIVTEVRDLIDRWVGSAHADAYWTNVHPLEDWAMVVLKTEPVLRSMYAMEDMLSSLRRSAINGLVERIEPLLVGELDYVPSMPPARSLLLGEPQMAFN